MERRDAAPTINMMICGSRRSGTSSLMHYLGEHPDIEFLDPRELDAIGGVARGLPFDSPFTAISCRPEVGAEYDAATARRRGYVRYLGWRAVYAVYFPHVAYNLADQLPGLKILFSLRDPADTTYSAYCRKLESGRTGATFEEELRLDPARARHDGPPGWPRFYDTPSEVPPAVARGFVHRGVRLFFDLFPREQIHAISFPDLVRTPQETLRGVLRFLEIDDDFTFTRAGTVKSASVKPGPMRAETRAALDEIFRDHNHRLFDLLGWKPDAWSAPASPAP